MHVDEEERVPRCSFEGLRAKRADAVAELREPPEALGGVEDRAGMGKACLTRAHERLVAEDAPRAGVHDGLKRHPHALERPSEARLQPGAIADLPVALTDQPHGIALHLRHATQAGRVLDRLDQRFARDRLPQILDGAERPLPSRSRAWGRPSSE